jgi:hypothetical protein
VRLAISTIFPGALYGHSAAVRLYQARSRIAKFGTRLFSASFAGAHRRASG